MCGICGEIRFDGESADVAAVTRMTGAMASRGPDSDGVVAHGPIALGHRRLSIIDLSARGAQPMVDSDLGLTLVFNGCIYNYQDLRTELEAVGYRFFSTADSEVVIKAFHRWGTRLRRPLQGHVRVRDRRPRNRRRHAGARPARDQAAVSWPKHRDGCGSPRPCARCSTAGDVDTELDRYALHHYMSFHSVVPAPRTIYRGVRKLPPATVRVIQPDGSHADTVYWTPVFERDPARASWTDARLAGRVDGRRCAPRWNGGWSPTSRSGCCCPAASTRRSWWRCWPSRASTGWPRSASASTPSAASPGDEYFYSDLIAKTFDTDHHRIHIDSSRLLPAVPKTIAAMSEPMVSHDCVAFYLLSEEVSKSVKVVQSGQGADEILAGYDWYPPLADVAREQTTEAYAKVFFDRDHADVLAIFAPEYGLPPKIPAASSSPAHQSAPGAETAVDAALRLDTQVMLVDDPVKRVDTMTMAWGLEARVPFLDHDFVELAATCPAELKLASGGKGVLKDASRALLPAEVIDRTKGYFPVPGIRHLHGDMLDMVRDALTNDAARTRGLYRRETVDALLAAPNETRTTLGANALWQLAVLEMWLQSMEN